MLQLNVCQSQVTQYLGFFFQLTSIEDWKMPILRDHLINQVNQSIGREDIELYGATKVDKTKLI